jgi:23S rRNA (cytidine2498-2'-O)-methyltransferase
MSLSDFVFATCRAGSEKALKKEVSLQPGKLLTPAFMRPQLITWKVQAGLPTDFVFDALLGVVCGWSLGMARSAEDVAEILKTSDLHVCALHVFPRLISEDGLTPDEWAPVEALADSLKQVCQTSSESHYILDVILGEAEEPWFIGCHPRSAASHPHAGGLPKLTIPTEAPSRAWLKMEQSLAWLGLDAPDLLVGKSALELGSAPGGASWSLLQRGMKVIGVDTGAVAACVQNHPNYDHVGLPASQLPLDYLPERIDLLACDMNLAPDVVLKYLEPLYLRLKPCWLVLTFKMNDARVEALMPYFIQQVRRFASGPVYAKQLHANRREVTLVSQSADV